MRWFTPFAAALLAALLPALATAQVATEAPTAQVATGAPAAQVAARGPIGQVQEARQPITILISIDGFRPDYLDRGVTPNLSRLAAEGASGPMRPSFPSKTFPNHWTIVTGMRPDRHGITANKIEDPNDPAKPFTMSTDDPKWWNAAEPIWVAAEQAGIRTGTTFWPGSNVAFGGRRTGNWDEIEGGTRPSDWAQFNMAITGEQRVNAALDLIRRPAAIRPKLVTLYFDTVDTAGHSFGPNDKRTTEAVAQVDAWIGMLVKGLAEMGQSVNFVIIADHGMAETSSKRTIVLSEVLPPNIYRVVESGPYAALVATPGREAELEKAMLGRKAHHECWRKAQIPARFHYGQNTRIPPYLCLADSGWLLVERAPRDSFTGGNHGYDHESPDMAALFIAHGPAFRKGTLPGFDNVDVYPLLRDLLGLPAARGVDGTDAVFRPLLIQR